MLDEMIARAADDVDSAISGENRDVLGGGDVRARQVLEFTDAVGVVGVQRNLVKVFIIICINFNIIDFIFLSKWNEVRNRLAF